MIIWVLEVFYCVCHAAVRGGRQEQHTNISVVSHTTIIIFIYQVYKYNAQLLFIFVFFSVRPQK